MFTVQFGNTCIPYTLSSESNKKDVSIIVEKGQDLHIVALTILPTNEIKKKAPWIF